MERRWPACAIAQVRASRDAGAGARGTARPPCQRSRKSGPRGMRAPSGPAPAACAASDRAIAGVAAYVLSAASLSRPAVRSDDIL